MGDASEIAPGWTGVAPEEVWEVAGEEWSGGPLLGEWRLVESVEIYLSEHPNDGSSPESLVQPLIPHQKN